jgi:hypothetical protein
MFSSQVVAVMENGMIMMFCGKVELNGMANEFV